MPKCPVENRGLLVVNRGISPNNIFEENYKILSEIVLKNPDYYLREENFSISMVMNVVKKAGR
jgi:hypothetical protein